MARGRHQHRASRAPLAFLLAYAFLLQIVLVAIAGAQAEVARFGGAHADANVLCLGSTGHSDLPSSGQSHDLCCMAACGVHWSAPLPVLQAELAEPRAVLALTVVPLSALPPSPLVPGRGSGARAPPLTTG